MIAFTICSNNYLAEAISLGNSLIKNDLESINFKIFLVDKLNPNVDYKSIAFSVVEVDRLLVPEFDKIKNCYNVVELNTAVKPSIFKHLLSEYENETLFAYFDPDIYIYQKIEQEIQNVLRDKEILLTPHVTQPVPLDKDPFENIFLNYGIYNLGFIALKRGISTHEMLKWWEERTIKLGVDDPANGLFVDQLWMNLVPIFFSGVCITNHLGFNSAYWNINERVVDKIDGVITINKTFPLIFFHFSSFDVSLNKLSKRYYTPPSWDLSTLNEMMEEYKGELERNSYSLYKKLAPAYKMSFDNFLNRNLKKDSRDKKLALIIKIHKFIPRYFLKKLRNLIHVVEIISKY